MEVPFNGTYELGLSRVTFQVKRSCVSLIRRILTSAQITPIKIYHSFKSGTLVRECHNLMVEENIRTNKSICFHNRSKTIPSPRGQLFSFNMKYLDLLQTNILKVYLL